MRKLYLYLLVACVLVVSGNAWGGERTYVQLKVDTSKVFTQNLKWDVPNLGTVEIFEFPDFTPEVTSGIRIKPHSEVFSVFISGGKLRSGMYAGVYDELLAINPSTGRAQWYPLLTWGGIRPLLFRHPHITIVYHLPTPPQPPMPTTNFQWFDFNMDGQIDFADFLKFAQCYGKTPEECNRE